VIPAAVDYLRAETLDEALAALEQPEAKALAGGQSLISVLKLRVVRPSVLVDLGDLDFRGIALDGELHIGALAVWRELTEAPELRRPALAAIEECASGIGDLQVRNRGTVGGSLAHADPASDFPAVAIALGAHFVVRSTQGERTVLASGFFHGPFLTALAPNELLTGVVVPVPPPGSGSAYVSVEHPASGFALAGAAAVAYPDGARSLALTGIAGAPVALTLPDDLEAGLAEIDVFGDSFASEEYRRHLAAVVARRALSLAETRREEDERWTA